MHAYSLHTCVAQVEPYHCQTLCSLGEIRKSKRLEYALSEADSYTTLSDQERLSKCEYTENAVKVEHLKPQTQAQNSASNLSQKAQVGKPSASTTTNRKGRPSNSSKVTIQASSQPLRDMTNDSSIATNSHAMGALSQISMTGAHEDLFKTLGMGTDERNHINMVANTLIQQIQAQILAALGQSAVATTARIETPKGTEHGHNRVCLNNRLFVPLNFGSL